MKRLLLALLLASTASAADIDVVRAQYIGYLTAAGADRSSARMQSALADLEASARHFTAPGYLRSDGSWSDVDYDDSPDGNWGPWDHSRRVIVLAKAYQTPGQAFHRDPRLRAQLDAALAYTKRFYGASIIPTGNWWFWTMGVPLDLAPSLVLMRGEIDQSTYDDLVYAVHLRIGSSPTARGIIGPTPVGQNLVWSSFTHLGLALLKDDNAMLSAVASAMSNVARPASGDGMKADRSFHQHGPQLYTGAYGGAFASDVARYALITRGTPYSLASDSLHSFSDYVADGIAWALHGDHFDVSVVGREVARPSTTGYQGLAALLQAAQFTSPRTAEIRAAAAKMLQTWSGTMPVELAGLAAQIESARFAASWPSGHRHYFASDYTVHRRDGWFASIKMFSSRTKSGERTNNENLLGARQSDGRFHLVLAGNEYFGRDVLPALDWSRLPGITVEQKSDTADDTYGFGKSAVAGGTGDGQNGVSAMELAPLHSSLTAKKAWFFFDDAIMFLTNDVTSASPHQIETVVNQWPLLNDSSQLTRGNDWAQLERVGYWFPTPSNLQIIRAARSGTWAGLGGSSDATLHTKTFVTMTIDHGSAPVNASAEYAIVPNVSASAMREWAARRPLAILANNELVSAVRDTRSGALGIVFWSAGASIDGIQSDAPAVVWIAANGEMFIADPTGTANGSLRITIPGRFTATVPSTRTPRSTTLTIPRAAGQTTKVVLTRVMPAKRRSVR